MEELRDLARQRRAAGDRDAEPAAEARLHLREDEPVGDPVLGGEAARHRPALLASTLTCRPTSSAQSISRARAPVASANFACTAVCTFS